MATTAPPVPAPSLHERLLHIWETPPGLFGVLGTVDHKKIGMRYLVTAFTFMLAGGLEAAAMRAQLSAPGLHLLSPEAYNQLFSMHGITMIFLYASPRPRRNRRNSWAARSRTHSRSAAKSSTT